jgi:hypothetical protein
MGQAIHHLQTATFIAVLCSFATGCPARLGPTSWPIEVGHFPQIHHLTKHALKFEGR